MRVFGFIAAVCFDERLLCDGAGDVMNERERMVDDGFFESVDCRLGVD